MMPEVIFEDDTKLAEFEATNKGYRKDVIVKIGDIRYKIYVTSMIRLHQDFEAEIQDSGYYFPEPNTIIVKEISKQEIEDTIYKIYKSNFFKRLDNNGFEVMSHGDG